MDKEMLALLGDSEAFGKKIAEFARAQALAEAAQEAAKAREADAAKREKAATEAESRLAGNEQNRLDALAKFEREKADFTSQAKRTTEGLEQKAAELKARENAVAAGEAQLASRVAAVEARERAVQSDLENARQAKADYEARVGRLKAAVS